MDPHEHSHMERHKRRTSFLGLSYSRVISLNDDKKHPQVPRAVCSYHIYFLICEEDKLEPWSPRLLMGALASGRASL